MSFPQKPSDCHPDLQEDRLAALAQFFASTRLGVASLHDASAGDDNWSLGCRSFARWRNNLLKKVQDGQWPWLNIINPGKRFIFGIGTVPVRFFRGSVNRPPERTLVNSLPELNQLTLAFDDTQTPYRDLKWRFAIETGYLGEPTAIVFAGLGREDGSVVCKWDIPFIPDITEIEPGEPRTDDMVELPPPNILVGPGYRVDTSSNNAS
jgi:hypothetical protein